MDQPGQGNWLQEVFRESERRLSELPQYLQEQRGTWAIRSSEGVVRANGSRQEEGLVGPESREPCG